MEVGMRFRSLAVAGAVLLFAVTLVASASAAPTKQLRCFSGSPGTCTLNPSSNSATLDTRSGGYAGAYLVNGKKVSGTSLSRVDFSFTYNCFTTASATECVNGGSPRLSIPIDEDGNGTVDGYAFLDPNGCGQAGQRSGTVSTNDPTCQVSYNGVTYVNWDDFAAQNPSFTIANALPFVIADQPFFGLVSNVSFTKV